jgi:hypothetical protein
MPQLLHAGLQAALDRLAERHPAIARAARSKAKQGRAYGQLLSAVSPKGASGIAQFMPQTADWHGLADPFDPIEALRHSAAYLRELRDSINRPAIRSAIISSVVAQWPVRMIPTPAIANKAPKTFSPGAMITGSLPCAVG